MRILLLEDDDIIAYAIKEYFELFENSVTLFSNGEDLLEQSDVKNFDIMLLDINTPKINGIEVLETIRAMNIDTPAIFITAKDSMDSIKKAYKIGCNDYIKKPFNIEELEIRINYIVHKNSSKIELKDGYKFDMSKQKLYRDKKEISLNYKEKQLIYLLLKNQGEIVENDTIKSYIWSEKEVCDNTLRTTIKKLRDKLDSNFIKNQRGTGYKIEI